MASLGKVVLPQDQLVAGHLKDSQVDELPAKVIALRAHAQPHLEDRELVLADLVKTRDLERARVDRRVPLIEEGKVVSEP